jgi:Zn finger protein HypA/HybF involved in hydrogenase expression
MGNVKWVKLKEMREMYSTCDCAGCEKPRNIDDDPSCCPHCGGIDFFTGPGSVLDLLKGRTRNLVCQDCDTDLSDEYVDMYPHDGGWRMSGVSIKLWMYIACPDCGCENSFDKFGIPRN